MSTEEKKVIAEDLKQLLESKGWLEVFQLFTGGDLGAVERPTTRFDFEVPFVRSRRIFASNAAVMVATIDELDDPATAFDTPGNFPPVTPEEFDLWKITGEILELPDIPPPPSSGVPCPVCKGKKYTVECDLCGGSGDYKCSECGTWHECAKCLDGEIPAEYGEGGACSACGGTGEEFYKAGVLIGDRFVDYRYLELMKRPEFDHAAYNDEKEVFICKGPELVAFVMTLYSEKPATPFSTQENGYYMNGKWRLPTSIQVKRGERGKGRKS